MYIYIHIVDVSVGPTATSFGGIACSLYFIAVSLSSGRPDVVLQRENQAQALRVWPWNCSRYPRKVRISPANSAGFTYRKILVPVTFQFHWRRRSQCLVFCRTNVDCPELPGVPAVGRSKHGDWKMAKPMWQSKSNSGCHQITQITQDWSSDKSRVNHETHPGTQWQVVSKLRAVGFPTRHATR